MLNICWSRYTVLYLVILLTLVFINLGTIVDADYFWPLIVLAPLSFIGITDLIQTRHSILRNYPIIGHFRFMLETIRPELRQYVIEDDRDPVPFSREQRALVYQRAKNVLDKQPFGTLLDVNAPGYGWITHSMRPLEIKECDFRVTIGGPSCRKPYAASILNISGTSFGALSANAIRAFNKGAKLGGFAHNTGEGSISTHHRKYGGDLIWQIATGYFGCRTPDGKFDPESFKQQAADPQVKMIEIKLSQGAKPGSGGVLPKAKITAEIAAARGVPRDRDCVSPPAHSEFSTPREMMQFIARLRDLADGKPVGIKLCIGHRYEFMAMVKAMRETGITPDFIVIDGKEGGTGAAPQELTNHVGLPMIDGLTFVHNTLIGASMRDRIKIGASGKIISAYDICRVFALGGDFVMSARGFMFAVGCVQGRSCHNNKCPTGVATQSPWRQRALVVDEKAKRVANFHHNTMKALGQILGAAGLQHPEQITPQHLHMRQGSGRVLNAAEAYPTPRDGALLAADDPDDILAREWRRARPDSFLPADA